MLTPELKTAIRRIFRTQYRREDGPFCDPLFARASLKEKLDSCTSYGRYALETWSRDCDGCETITVQHFTNRGPMAHERIIELELEWADGPKRFGIYDPLELPEGREEIRSGWEY